MPQSYCHLLYHIVFSTKHRQRLLTPDIAGPVHEYIGSVIRDHKGFPILINGVEDHVHILAKFRQDVTVSDMLRAIKANSSGWVHHAFPNHKNFAWQNGYGAFSVSPSLKEKTRRYILDQEKHHQKTEFKTEFISLLDAHEVEYDLRYVWD